jgi:hypothetical protein
MNSPPTAFVVYGRDKGTTQKLENEQHVWVAVGVILQVSLGKQLTSFTIRAGIATGWKLLLKLWSSRKHTTYSWQLTPDSFFVRLCSCCAWRS